MTPRLAGLQFIPYPMAETTLLLIKPDAVQRRRTGEILRRVEESGFTIVGLKMHRLSVSEAKTFYAIHEGKDFFPGLVEFITSGPIVAAALQAPDCRRRLRLFVGATDPAKAAAGTIRRDFGTTVRMNAVHASNPEEDVERELSILFPEFAT